MLRPWEGAAPRPWAFLPCAALRPQRTAFCTSAPIRASSAAVTSVSAKAVGPMAPSSRCAVALKPSIAYRVLNFCALWTKQTTVPSWAYAGIPQILERVSSHVKNVGRRVTTLPVDRLAFR
jgi:hypothetical protein